MKYFVFLILLLSGNIFACPQLNPGEFSCFRENGPGFEMFIEMHSDSALFEMGKKSLLYEFPFEHTNKITGMKTNGTCSDQEFHIISSKSNHIAKAVIKVSDDRVETIGHKIVFECEDEPCERSRDWTVKLKPASQICVRLTH